MRPGPVPRRESGGRRVTPGGRVTLEERVVGFGTGRGLGGFEVSTYILPEDTVHGKVVRLSIREARLLKF